mmetsp:Transcript_24998/g.68686  ORF Transcript_24998/g.68686 Transcript_24998/m.68686 type:complete len:237 (+) Transcript_24998:53-763(+)
MAARAAQGLPRQAHLVSVLIGLHLRPTARAVRCASSPHCELRSLGLSAPPAQLCGKGPGAPLRLLVVGPVERDARSELLPEESLRLRPALAADAPRKVVHVAQRAGVRGPERLAPDVQGFPEELLGLVGAPRIVEQQRQVAHAGQRVRVPGPQCLAPADHDLPEEPLGVVEVAPVLQQRRQVADAQERARVVGPERLSAAVQGLQAEVAGLLQAALGVQQGRQVADVEERGRVLRP